MPPLLVHVLDRQLGAHLLQDALARPGAGQRDDQRDLHLARVLRARASRRQRGGGAGEAHLDGGPASKRRRHGHCCHLPWLWFRVIVALRFRQTEIRAADPIVGQQGLDTAPRGRCGPFPARSHDPSAPEPRPRAARPAVWSPRPPGGSARFARRSCRPRWGPAPSTARPASGAGAHRPGRGRSPASAARRPTGCPPSGRPVRPGSGTACGCGRASASTARARSSGMPPSPGFPGRSAS